MAMDELVRVDEPVGDRENESLAFDGSERLLALGAVFLLGSN